MVTLRKSTVTHEDFFKNKTLELVVEGTFQPLNDIFFVGADAFSAHFKINGYARWGVTFPIGKTLAEVRQRDAMIGYFHIHKQERVYVNAVRGDDEGNTLIPCYECGVAIRGKW